MIANPPHCQQLKPFALPCLHVRLLGNSLAGLRPGIWTARRAITDRLGIDSRLSSARIAGFDCTSGSGLAWASFPASASVRNHLLRGIPFALVRTCVYSCSLKSTVTRLVAIHTCYHSFALVRKNVYRFALMHIRTYAHFAELSLHRAGNGTILRPCHD